MPDTCMDIQRRPGMMPGDRSLQPPWISGLADMRHMQASLALLDRLRAHHPPSAAHSVRVARLLVVMGGRASGAFGDPATLATAGALHDIGKLFVSATTLSSGRELSPDERNQVREHPATGARVLGSLGFDAAVVAAAREHHERWGGEGYPTGRPSRLLHPLGRFVAVADAFVAMVEPGRAYRAPLGQAAALAEIARCSGTQFDPAAAALLLASFAGDRAASFEIVAI